MFDAAWDPAVAPARSLVPDRRPAAAYFFLGFFWLRALPAAVLAASLYRLSRRTFDAVDAAFLLVDLDFGP